VADLRITLAETEDGTPPPCGSFDLLPKAATPCVACLTEDHGEHWSEDDGKTEECIEQAGTVGTGARIRIAHCPCTVVTGKATCSHCGQPTASHDPDCRIALRKQVAEFRRVLDFVTRDCVVAATVSGSRAQDFAIRMLSHMRVDIAAERKRLIELGTLQYLAEVRNG
jgi:hypothetical protein